MKETFVKRWLSRVSENEIRHVKVPCFITSKKVGRVVAGQNTIVNIVQIHVPVDLSDHVMLWS
jgi:hypothetical protein